MIGCVPAIGDVACVLPSLYIVFTAQGMGAPPALVLRMLANILFDAGAFECLAAPFVFANQSG